MKDLKIKIITGFRKDQQYSISADEAHKAYYLFLHPEERGIFDNGIALKGSSIDAIEPDYHGSMGWNPDHKLDDDDWNQIRLKGMDRKLRDVLFLGKTTARVSPERINVPLSEIKMLNEK